MLDAASKWTPLIGPIAFAACLHSGAATVAPQPAVSVTHEGALSPDAAERLSARGLMVPVEGVSPDKVRDTFTAQRGGRVHAALDILAPRGTLVLSADSGRVWKVRSNELGGRTVYVLDLAEEFVHYYAHLDRYRPGLFEGELVGPGDLLGYVGTTGNAAPNEPHLHYQLLRYRGNGRWWDGEPINPHGVLRHPGRATVR